MLRRARAGAARLPASGTLLPLPPASRNARYSSIGHARKRPRSRPEAPVLLPQTPTGATVALQDAADADADADAAPSLPPAPASALRPADERRPGPAATVAETAPAFLAARPRIVPSNRRHSVVQAHGRSELDIVVVRQRPKPSPAPSAPLPPSSLAAPAVAMARRGPRYPGWENPPRLENFPRLRSREDRRANQPLLLAAVGMALVMVTLVLFPILMSPKGSSLAPDLRCQR